MSTHHIAKISCLNALCCFSCWIVYFCESKIIFNHEVRGQTSVLSLIDVSYNQCVSLFRSNTSLANIMVYKRKFSLCETYTIPGFPVYTKTPGSILALDRLIDGRDCLELFEMGCKHDGVYTIQPVNRSSLLTWCDMKNGGWTVIQRRMDGSENFYRTWAEYVHGFGSTAGEYWIGLENIVELTKPESSLKIEMKASENMSPTRAYALYQVFKLENETSNFKLNVSGFSGDCGDSLLLHDGYMFSTIDKDNDVWPGNCAVTYQGGWWYRKCHSSNLNGLYLSENDNTYATGINWSTCWGYYYSIRNVEIKVRRNHNINTFS